MSYHLAYQIETPTGTYRAGLEVWIVKRSGTQLTINLAPPSRPQMLMEVEREMIRVEGLRSHRDLAPCGTPAAYRRHQRRLEDPCAACDSAWHRYQCGRDIKRGHIGSVKVDVDVLAELYLAADFVTQQTVESALGVEVMTAVVDRFDRRETVAG